MHRGQVKIIKSVVDCWSHSFILMRFEVYSQHLSICPTVSMYYPPPAPQKNA